MYVVVCSITFIKQYVFVIQDKGHNPASITSEDLEQKFTQDNTADIEFIAGSQTYTLSFQGTAISLHSVYDVWWH